MSSNYTIIWEMRVQMFIRSLLAFLLGLPAAYAFADCSHRLIGAKNRDGKYQWQGRCFKLTKGCQPCGKIHTRKIKYMTKRHGSCSRRTIASERADGCSAPSTRFFFKQPGLPTNPRKLIQLKTPYKYKFKAACDEHDVCYSSLGRNKRVCDRSFYNNMIDMCKRSGKGCKSMAWVYFRFVSALGNSSYLDGQNYANKKCQ